jgi:hypothetical protein
MDDGPSNVVSMARIELIQDPHFGDLYTGPAPIIRGTRFQPLQEIRVEVSCADGHGRVWKSSNAYLVSAEGIFDTSLTPAVGEDYYGVAREGPFTSMTCQYGPGHDFGSKNLHRLQYKIACFDHDGEIWSGEATRYLGRDLDRVPEPRVRVLLFDDEVASDELDAMFALAPYGVAVVGNTMEECGHTDGQPRSARDLPTFIVGSGRASARALEAAICLPNNQAVILFSGGGLRFDPIKGGYCGPDGEWISTDLGYISLDHSSLQPRSEGVLSTRKLYAEAVADRKKRDKGRIKVEHIGCPIYMFSGSDDQIWPSSAFSELVAQRRKMKSCHFPTVHRTFEGVGHDLGPSLGLPTLPTTERTIGHPDTGFRLLLGGKMGRQARARRECWDTLLQILSGDPPQQR